MFVRATTLLSAALLALWLSPASTGQEAVGAVAKAAITLSCDSSMEGDLTECETGCGANSTEAGVEAVSNAIAGGADLKCKGCPDGQKGCDPGWGGTNIKFGVFKNPVSGETCVTICPGGGGPSKARFSCSACEEDDGGDGDGGGGN